MENLTTSEIAKLHSRECQRVFFRLQEALTSGDEPQPAKVSALFYLLLASGIDVVRALEEDRRRG